MGTQLSVWPRAAGNKDNWRFLFWPVWGGAALVALVAGWWGYYFYISLALLPSISVALLLWRRHARWATAWIGVALAGLVFSPLGYGGSVYRALLVGKAPGNAWQMALNRAVFDAFGFDLSSPHLLLALTLCLIALLQWPLLRQKGARRDSRALALWVAANGCGSLMLEWALNALVSAGVQNMVLLFMVAGLAWAAVMSLALRYLERPASAASS